MRFSTSAAVVVGILGSQAVAAPIVREEGLPRFRIGTVKPLPEGHGPVVQSGEPFNNKITREAHPPASSYLQLGEEVHRLPEGHGPVVHNGKVARDPIRGSRPQPQGFHTVNHLPVFDENHKVARDPVRGSRPQPQGFHPVNHFPVFDEKHKVARDPEPKHRVDIDHVAHRVGQGASIANDVTSVIQNGQQILHPNGKRKADPEPFRVHMPHFHHQQPAGQEAQGLTQRDPEPKHRVDLDTVAHHASQGASIANDVTSVIQNGQQILHPNGKREADPEPFHVHMPHFHHQQAPSQDQAQPLSQREADPEAFHVHMPHFHHQQAPSQDQAQPLAQREAEPEAFHIHMPHFHHQQAQPQSQDQAQPIAQREAEPEAFHVHMPHFHHQQAQPQSQDQAQPLAQRAWFHDHVAEPMESWMGKTFTSIHRREAEAEPTLPHFRIGTLSPEVEDRMPVHGTIGVLEPKKTARSFSA